MTFVGTETIRAIMLKHKRHLCYLYDHKQNLIWCNEDETDPEKVFEDLAQQIGYCSGQFVIVELKGGAEGRGGNRKNTEVRNFTYHVRLNNGNNNSNANPMGGGAMPIIVELLREQSNLRTEIAKKDYEATLREINAKLERYREKEDESPIGEFARVVMDEYRNGKKLEGAVKKAAEKVPLSDEAKNGNKQKLAEALAKLKTVDPDYLDNLIRLGEYAKKHPAIYNALKEQLNEKTEASEPE